MTAYYKDQEASQKKLRDRYVTNKEWYRTYRKHNRNKINAYQRNYRIRDTKQVILYRLRLRINSYCKGKSKSKHTAHIIGCSPNQLELFVGIYPGPGYELDHICPLSQAKTEEEIYKLNHYSNLQWLTTEDNRKKSDNKTVKGVILCNSLLGRDWEDITCKS